MAKEDQVTVEAKCESGNRSERTTHVRITSSAGENKELFGDGAGAIMITGSSGSPLHTKFEPGAIYEVAFKKIKEKESQKE